MTTRRLVANLVAFVVVSLGFVAYGVVDLLGDPLVPGTTISAVLPNASGISSGFTVELNGVDVGSVRSVALAPHGARVVMAIDHGVEVPGDVRASIGIANDLGEQVVELTPDRHGSAPPLASGAVVPAAPDGVPASVGQVVASATRLLDAIPAGRLDQLLGELATALRGRAGDLRTIVAAGTTFADEFRHYERSFDALLANAPPVLDAVTAVGPQLEQALVNTASLVQVLATHRDGLTGLLVQGSKAAGLLRRLLASQAPDLACLLHDGSQLMTDLSQPANLADLSAALATNQLFFGAVEAVTVPGTAKPLTAGGKATTGQYFLRTRLLLPPASPPGIAYPVQRGLPAVSPGAGCSTELGQGVGPAQQAGFSPAAGGSLSPPTAAEARVRGGGTAATPGAAGATPGTPSSYRSPLAPPGGLPLAFVGALVVPALLLAWGARPSRRNARRRG